MRKRRLRMGKMQCPSCLGDVSSGAKACRHCGHAFSATQLEGQAAFEKRMRRQAPYGCTAVLVLTLAVGTCAYRTAQPPSVEPAARDGRSPEALAGAKHPSASNPLGLANLTPSTRFSEYGRGEPFRPAQDALNAGDVGTAYDLFSARDMSADGAREKRFDAVIDKAWNQWSKSDPTADYVERVSTYWTPEAMKLPNYVAVNDEEGVRKINLELDLLLSYAADAEGKRFSQHQDAIVRRFFEVLSEKQKLLLPAIRKAVATKLGETWFRSNIEASVSGGRHEVLRLTSPSFVKNSEIVDMEEGAGSNFLRPRFKRVEYRWSRYIGDGFHYDLKPPSDATVARWDEPNSQFHVIKVRGR